VYAVVLAGGGGTRLWPLSRPERPKPFLRLLGDESLIQRTVARLSPLIRPEDVYVIAERRHLPLVAEQLPAVPASHLLGEPVGRNTAAAVALAAEAIDRPDGEVMFILPADAHVENEEGFRAALGVAEEAARAGSLVTLGVTPNRPETGYGYVVARGPAPDEAAHRWLAVDRFVEKPTAERAADLIATGLASWNAGIFAWTRATIRDSLQRYAPDIVGPLRVIFRTAGPHDLDAVYPDLRATSIDYAVMEPASIAGSVAVVPMNVGWSDLGSWAALRDAWQARLGRDSADGTASGTVGLGNRMDIGSSGSLVVAGDRLVVTIGLNDVIVVDTPEAVLVVSAEHAQDVREAAQRASTGRLHAAQEEAKP
jgi:mannose-1-phosphate guanylyltransferase/mannose-6-phosphate isomerase